ncbi:MAG: flagellar basal body P-ring formation chaperone FlgA [Thiogranum sp.]
MPNFKITSVFILLAIAAWQPLKVVAAPPATAWQSHAAIRTAAQGFLQAFVGDQHQGRSRVKLGQLDHRLQLKACHTPLEAFMPPGGRAMGNTTVGVRCPDQGGWSIYVSARIDVFGPVLVASQPLARGTRIEASDLELLERNLSNLPYGYYSDKQAAVGLLAKRTIATTTVITPTMLQEPTLVKRGERVSIIAENGPLKIRSSGKALRDGKSGEVIGIRAEGSRRTVEAVVVSEGVVKVTL